MMTIREIESGSDIMEVNRLAGLIWHEAYRGIVSREQIAYMIERFQCGRLPSSWRSKAIAIS